MFSLTKQGHRLETGIERRTYHFGAFYNYKAGLGAQLAVGKRRKDTYPAVVEARYFYDIHLDMRFKRAASLRSDNMIGDGAEARSDDIGSVNEVSTGASPNCSG